MTFKVLTIHRGDLGNPVEETLALTYQIRKVMNDAAFAAVILNDDSFAALQKYDTTGANSYLGGRIQIEEPINTCVFDGCIVRIEADPNRGIIRLFARDWLQQLMRSRIDFDTRRDLDGAGLRESYAHGDIDNASEALKQAVYTVGGAPDTYFMVDDNMAWGNDDWNGDYVIFSNKMAGDITIKTCPYNEVVTPTGPPMGTDSPGDGEESVWVDDSSCHTMLDNADYDVVYYFYTSCFDSTYYVANSTTAIRLVLTYFLTSGKTCDVYLYDDTAAGYVLIDSLDGVASGLDRKRVVINIPGYFWERISNGSGANLIKFDVQTSGGNTNFWVYYVCMEVDCTMTGDNSAYEILDTTATNLLEVDDQLNPDIWDGCPYSIAPVITTHLADLVGDYDTDVTLDYSSDVTASTDISARAFLQHTPLEILQYLAKDDGTDFWLDNGLDVHWNDSYAVGGCDTWTDSSVLTWVTPCLDVTDIRNSVKIKGVQLHGAQVEASDTDAGSIANYGTYSLFYSRPSLYSLYEAENYAGTLVDRYKDPPYRVGAVLNGFTYTEVGEVIEIQSTDLDLNAGGGGAAVYYVITEIEYDLDRGTSYVVLAPRASYLHIQRNYTDTMRYVRSELDELQGSVSYDPPPDEIV